MPRKRSTTPDVATLQARIAELESDIADLQILYENTMEHGTALENELMHQNERMEHLQNQMRKYLSPQLYQALLGGKTEASTKGHTRTKLTVYFSDMVGFSDLTDSTEPELLSDILNTYLTRMSEIALKYGGTIDKFIGDAMMVFFGAPEFISDQEHAQRCVRMALDMRRELYLLREEWQLKGINRMLRVRAGINTGYCTVGNFGSDHRMDYTIIGNQVNLASRLQSTAPPDGIYISSMTYALVEDIVEARHIGLTQVKGIHTPVDVWELIGLRAEAALASKYVTFEQGLLQLKELTINPSTLTEQERIAFERAFAQALIYLASGNRQ